MTSALTHRLDALNDSFVVDGILYSRPLHGSMYARPMVQVLPDHGCETRRGPCCVEYLHSAAEMLSSDPPTDAELDRWVRTGFWVSFS